MAESSFRRAAIGETRIWCLYQSNSQNFSEFYCRHFLGRREKGVFPVPFRSRFEKVLEVFPFSPLAEKRGSLEGVRERGFNYKSTMHIIMYTRIWACALRCTINSVGTTSSIEAILPVRDRALRLQELFA